MPSNYSKQITYKYNKLYLNDGTHNLSDEHFHEVKPTYAGDLKYSIQSDNHNGWLKCDGSSVERAKYPNLFNVIGTSFGSIDEDYFNLPDCRGRVLGVIGNGSGLTNRTLGVSVGTETHTLTVNEMPAHTHTINDPGHNHSYVNNVNNQSTDNAFSTEIAADNADLNQTTGTSTTGITINSNGGGNAHNNMQPTIFISNVFIYAY
jgi:microcystin-dependent protein